MQETDEQAHADYAYALFDANGWFVARHARAEDYVTAQVRYLAAKSDFWNMRLSRDARAPTGYGSESYFGALDRSAPPVTVAKLPARAVAVPYVAFLYPAGYYVLSAAVMRLAASADHGSLVATYFAARGLGIVFLVGTLCLAFMTLRELHFSRARALWLTMALAIMPLGSWVSSYIQPDTLVMLLATLVIYCCVRWQKQPFERSRSTVLVLALAASFCVKQHYALALSVGAGLMVLAYVPSDRSRAYLRLLGVGFSATLLSAAWILATSVTPTGPLHPPPALFAVHVSGMPAFAKAARFGAYVVEGAVGAFVGGQAFDTYWLSYGDLLTPYIAWPALAALAKVTLAILSATVAVALGARQAGVAARLAPILKRRPWTSVRLIFGDAILNIYVVWTALLLSVFAASGGQVYLEGRYFLPMLLPTVLLGVKYMPRIFPRRTREHVSRAATACWVAYGVTMSVFALFSIQLRFYGEPNGTRSTRVVHLVRVTTNDGRRIDNRTFSLSPRSWVRVDGWAISLHDSFPFQGIAATLDGRALTVIDNYRHAVRYGVGSENFSIQTPNGLRPGRHDLRIAPRPARAGDQKERLEIDVTS